MPHARPALRDAGFEVAALVGRNPEKTKADIVRLALEIGAPLAYTWSCYKGNEKHCGRCGTCVERKHAFRDAMVANPTQYEDPEYGLTCNLSIAPA